MQGHQALGNSSKCEFPEELKYGETISEMQAHKKKKTETEGGIRRERKRKEKGKTERRKL